MAQVDPKAVNRWSARFIPALLIGVVGYTAYVFTVRLCIHYLLRDSNRRPGSVIALLVVYFLLFLFMATSYFRILYIVNVDPGYIPLGPAAQNNRDFERPQPRRRRSRSNGDSIDGPEYRSSKAGELPDTNPDSPGLEQFYSKDVFVCESDGRPRWCNKCGNWKPDRTHHCSDIGRCVRKMDHFCPWVGGVVGENSFKFFIQFVFYTCLFSTFLVIVMAIYVHEQITSRQPGVKVDPHFAAIIGLGGFFGAFTGGMAASSISFAMGNLTTVENLNKDTVVFQLAAIISHSAQTSVPAKSSRFSYITVTYPLPIPSEKPNSRTIHPDDVIGDPSQTVSSNPSPNSQTYRDSKATRTFAILRMEPGQNPWDLGSYGNWKTVMGDSLLDWILPISRSPSCNHENSESQFALGWWAEKLRSDHGLLPHSSVHSPSPRARHRQERLARKRARDIEMQNVDEHVP